MSGSGLSDADVERQIKQMMAFIEQEANEKKEEIDNKAEEEFNIEKSRLVQQERVKILEFYGKKEKQTELQKKIQHSNMKNDGRLRVLKARDQHLRDVLTETTQRLREIVKDQGKYAQLMEGLVTQGLFQLLEPEAVLRCRQADVHLVERVMGAAADRYKRETGRPVKLQVDKQNFLPPDSVGGVDVIGRAGKIRVCNNLESRLEQISAQMVPELRYILFGGNPNRKFMD
ncbi:hypothetical protein BOX15_Mlig006708g1 [Macrostomum lignano]|uniref:V-type proton ATPase subunit E n=2 Tax=Macrostomum lignano TaxID=282301 RepID=A0A1I8GDK2_9PLAT|nr:hypothetical protein BOX15_Mlig006708g3 [Macrostomum lignano]PAA57797.1 hypothetical protein BOX15_Mlig006708g2 [Macrostomum lignano]PAA87248.1 hypothetical protein BOX15_Mlig006708g1 [Macrostomum lignano]